MKKLFSICTIILAMLCVVTSSMAQTIRSVPHDRYNQFAQTNKFDDAFDVSLAYHDNFVGASVGLSISYCYLDGNYLWGYDDFADSYIWSGHIGFNVPIIDYFGYNVTITPSAGIASFDSEDKYFDYGFVLRYRTFVFKAYSFSGASIGFVIPLGN